MNNTVLTVNHGQIPRILLMGWLSKIPICLIGSVGTGKTSSFHTFYNALAENLPTLKKYVVFPGLIEASDIGGIPFVALDEKRKQKCIEFAMLKLLPFDTDDECLILFDEFDRADKHVQNACMQILLNGHIHGHQLSPNSMSILTMNGSTDIYTTPLSEAVRTRVCSLFVSNVARDNLDAWDLWAEEEGIHESVRGFAHFKPDLVEREIEYKELAIPNPRSRDDLSKIMKQLDNVNIRTDDILLPMFAGLIGKAGAIEFKAYLETFAKLPDIRVMLDDPSSIPPEMFTDPASAFALASYLIKNVDTRNDAIKLIDITKKLRMEIAFWVIDSIKRKIPDVISSAEYIAWDAQTK